ncbi:MAG: hypothetical protein ACP5NL_06100 [Thermoplasmata archaeon]
MAKKEQNKKDEELPENEYLQTLEEEIEELLIALIIDMKKKGIFVEKDEEFDVSDKFLKDIKKELNGLDIKDEDESIAEAIVNTIKKYYSDALEDEELFPRGDIVMGYIYEELQNYLDNK